MRGSLWGEGSHPAGLGDLWQCRGSVGTVARTGAGRPDPSTIYLAGILTSRFSDGAPGPHEARQVVQRGAPWRVPEVPSTPWEKAAGPAIWGGAGLGGGLEQKIRLPPYPGLQDPRVGPGGGVRHIQVRAAPLVGGWGNCTVQPLAMKWFANSGFPGGGCGLKGQQFR